MSTTPDNRVREKLVLTKEEGRDIVSDDHPDYEVVSDEINGKSRWADCHDIIIQRISDGHFFKDGYRRGSTEACDERAYDFDLPDFTEVFPVEKTFIVYE